MASLAPSSSLPANRSRPRFWGTLALVALFAAGLYYWFDAALQYLLRPEESVFRRYWPNRLWLVAHIAGGSLALLTGPFQLWSGFRHWQPRLHRGLGYVYALGIAVGGGSSFVLAIRSSIPDFGFALFFLGFAWWHTLGMALIAIRNRRFEAHRDWMIRSYIVTFGFVMFRFIVDWPVFAGLGRTKLAAVAWACWVLPLLIAEIFLHWRHVGPRRAAAEKSGA